MIKIMECEGANKYKIPHIGKDKMLREGMLPTSVNVPIELVDKTFASIQRMLGLLDKQG